MPVLFGRSKTFRACRKCLTQSCQKPELIRGGQVIPRPNMPRRSHMISG